MRQSGGNPDRHWHNWTPNDKDVRSVKTCRCGATKEWRGTKWAVKPKRKTKDD